ncbi:MAG: Primosomal protein [Planctomycetota bacterium]|jgi:primosomal protein N' (replication factor Y)
MSSIFALSEDSLFSAQEAAPTAPAAGVYARVAVERGIETLDGPPGFTYRVDGPPPAVGERVIVPLGRGDASSPGIVLEVGGPVLAKGIPPGRIKAVLETTGVVLPGPLMDLGRWMADYYLSPPGMVYASILPAAVKRQVGRREITLYARAATIPDPLPPLKPAARRLWACVAAMGAGEFPLPLKTLLERSGVKGAKAAAELVAAGLLVASESSTISAREIDRDDTTTLSTAPELNADQVQAADGIAATLGRFHVHLLRGVTGSGKTEVYLRVLAKCLEMGRTAIVLVPEISLTPQTSSRFTARFGVSKVAVLHSGLTAAQRHREWERAASGAAKVIVGARSAVFAPLASLGLLVIDEEHDSSYKQDRLPRYHGRDVAIKRAHLEGATVLLGSATPSLESWSNATGPAARFSLWTLPRRAGNAAMPDVRIIDMADERRRRREQGDGNLQHLIGPTLERALGETLDAGGQALLLLNRRGFSGYISCQSASCGFVLSCDQCDANLVLHRHHGLPQGGLVQCHHCESQQRVPRACPSCGKPLNLFAGGTQRLEEELARKFGSRGLVEGVSFARVDSDTMQSSRDYFDTLGRFARGELRLLLGTQMIAKGLDFPDVRLVGVIDADTSLNIPDFRATERTFQLVSQVAGRAGRGSKPGVVLVQTQNPTNMAITLAQRHDFEEFAKRELEVRRRVGLPPIGRMARIVCRDLDEAKASAAAAAMASALRDAAPPSVGVRGPLPCPISRVANHFRFGVDVLGPDAKTLHRVLASLRGKSLLKSDAATAVDVDPVALM